MSLTWVFDGLKSEPYGLIPYANLTGKGSTTVRYVKKLGSYNWLCQDDLEHPTIVVPGEPREQQAFNGCKMPADTEDLLFDPNIVGLPRASLDPVFEVLRQKFDKKGQPIDFQKYDIVTDVLNLQKLFAFCRGDGDGGLFRIDVERIGKLVLFNRIEGAGYIPVDPDYPSFDVNLKNRVSRSRCPVTDGPYQQISSYQFGAFNILVRYQPEYAEYTPDDWLLEPRPQPENVKDSTEAFPNSGLHYLKYGETCDCSLSLLSSYPEGRGFPNCFWPSMFFSGADRLLVGWFKGTGEFPKPASYSLADMNKLVKPLPYPIVTRVHDLLNKIINFMRGCDEDVKISLIWQGFPHLEIYERAPQTPPPISENVRTFLRSQCGYDETADSEPEPGKPERKSDRLQSSDSKCTPSRHLPAETSPGDHKHPADSAEGQHKDAEAEKSGEPKESETKHEEAAKVELAEIQESEETPLKQEPVGTESEKSPKTHKPPADAPDGRKTDDVREDVDAGSAADDDAGSAADDDAGSAAGDNAGSAADDELVEEEVDDESFHDDDDFVDDLDDEAK